ncbi:MAG: aminotransferase class IV, partial [Nitrospiraceae bacterium]
LPNVMARQQAKEAGAFEAIFVRAGEVIEGAVSNVMMVRSGVLVTALADERILSGVTRAVVLDLARKEGIPVEERAIRVEELRGADEIFLTGTTVEILPVIGVDGVTVGTGRVGELTRLLSHRFRSSVE